MKRRLLIIPLSFIYLIMSVAVTIFFAAAGDGCYTPPVILLSWSLMPGMFFGNIYAYITLPLIYLGIISTIFILSSFQNIISYSKYIGAFQLSGWLFAILFVEQGHLATLGIILISSLISFILLASYSYCLYLLIKASNQCIQADAAEPRRWCPRWT